MTNEFQSPPLFILLHYRWISQQVGVGPVQMCTLHSEQCTQCTVYGMYTMYSVWNVHSEQCMECTVYNTFCCRGISAVVTRFSCGFSTKQLQVQIHNPKLCAKQKCLWELERGRGGALLCWAVTHFSCSALLHDSTLLWLDSTHSDENDAHAIIPAGDSSVTGGRVFDRCKSCNNQIFCFWILSIYWLFTTLC